jgi:hypothetical protein
MDKRPRFRVGESYLVDLEDGTRISGWCLSHVPPGVLFVTYPSFLEDEVAAYRPEGDDSPDTRILVEERAARELPNWLAGLMFAAAFIAGLALFDTWIPQDEYWQRLPVAVAVGYAIFRLGLHAWVRRMAASNWSNPLGRSR